MDNNVFAADNVFVIRKMCSMSLYVDHSLTNLPRKNTKANGNRKKKPNA